MNTHVEQMLTLYDNHHGFLKKEWDIINTVVEAQWPILEVLCVFLAHVFISLFCMDIFIWYFILTALQCSIIWTRHSLIILYPLGNAYLRLFII